MDAREVLFGRSALAQGPTPAAKLSPCVGLHLPAKCPLARPCSRPCALLRYLRAKDAAALLLHHWCESRVLMPLKSSWWRAPARVERLKMHFGTVLCHSKCAAAVAAAANSLPGFEYLCRAGGVLRAAKGLRVQNGAMARFPSAVVPAHVFGELCVLFPHPCRPPQPACCVGAHKCVCVRHSNEFCVTYFYVEI
jgi:hypothetical protein